MPRFVCLLTLLLSLVLHGAPAPAQAPAHTPAQSQRSIEGQVRDAATLQLMGYASVFLANTTYGTTTDSTGRFHLAGVPAGQYELTVSYLGYQLYKKTLTLPLAAPILVNLAPAAAKLNEVVVRPRKNSPADMRRFLTQFLGLSALSQQCRLENPDDLIIVYDAKSQELTAVAPRGLRVLNPALGYRIIYHDFSFKVLYRLNRCEFVAAPLFEELPSPDDRQRLRRDERRRAVYLGSLPHFLRSVRENRVQEDGFVAQALEWQTGPARPKTPEDSLSEVVALRPGVWARVYRRPLSAADLSQTEPDQANPRLQFAAGLQVTYPHEKPDPVYAAEVSLARRNDLLGGTGRRWQGAQTQSVASRVSYETVAEVSQLRLLGPPAFILPNGYLGNPLSVQVDGYWAFEKVGEALPLDYVPAPAPAATAGAHQ